MIQEVPELTLEIMSELNDDENVHRVSAEGDIPFLDSKSMALMLVDTPGPNNAQNQAHKNTTYRAINSDSNNLILYVLNGTQLSTNAIAEMRTYGEGFIIADQSPGLLDMAVIRNTNTKIIMRLPEYSDRELVGRAASLNDEQITEIAKLSKGVAAIYQNDWLEAVLCKVREYTPEDVSPFTYHAPYSKESADIKGTIISRLIAKDIHRLTDGISDKDIIKATMPASAKCQLFEYAHIPYTKKLDSAASIAYELFAAQSVFSALSGQQLEYEQQIRFISEHLDPSLTPLPDEYAKIILYLVTYHHAKLTESSSSRLLLNALIDADRKGEII